jgi:hypothetical protein
MSKEIKVVFEDIRQASVAFQRHGKEYDAIVPKSISPIPAVTEGSLRDALYVVLRAIAVMHDTLGASMHVHGDKLKFAYNRYRTTEDNASELLRHIDDPKAINPKL